MWRVISPEGNTVVTLEAEATLRFIFISLILTDSLSPNPKLMRLCASKHIPLIKKVHAYADAIILSVRTHVREQLSSLYSRLSIWVPLNDPYFSLQRTCPSDMWLFYGLPFSNRFHCVPFGRSARP